MTTTRTALELDSAVGVPLPRLDATAKVTGKASYAGDRALPGLLHGRPVLSPYAHARILGIDAGEALQIAGVHAVLTAADLPIRDGSGRAGEPLARSEVVFAGQPVALVVAETESAAEDAAEAVVVDYEPLPAVVDAEQALEPGSPPARIDEGSDESDVAMHGDAGGEGQEAESASTNVLSRHEFSEGDVETVLAECAAVVQGRFRTSWVHQTYLEPQVAVAWPEADGRLVVRSSTQGIFYTRQLLARVLGLPLPSVRVEAATLGGGFGGKIGLIDPLVAAAALAIGRPVRIALTRSEDFAAGNPAPGFVIDLRVGARADGTLAALDGKVVIDSGAFSEMSPAPLAAGRLGGPYRFEAWRAQAYGVRTNRFGAGAYRGPTAPQTAFALETLLDELADELGIDRVELRLHNTPDQGDLRLDGSRWPLIGLRETLEAVREHPLWLGRSELPPNEGVGLAVGLFPGGKMGAAATCRMDADGGFTVVTGYVDMTGTETGIAAIAAATLGVPFDQVRVAAGDTDAAPQSGVSGGSMVTYSLGPAVVAAAADAREQVIRIVSEELEIDPSDLELADGAVRPVGSPQRGVSLADLGARLTGFGSKHPPVEGHGTALNPEIAPSAAASLAHVRVDPDTGRVEVLALVAAQDVGRAINPALCRGQMWGGAAQAIGFALHESLVHDEDGQLLTSSFLNYSVPTSEAVPPIETIIVEVPSPHGPLGARGIGESAIVPGAAAIANAVAAVTGHRFRELPIRPEQVWQAIREATGGDAEQ
jgi:CO/xanthine dehydrogenase Mo-binding subunit